VCVSESVCERESVCVRECVRERVCVCERERVCVREREVELVRIQLQPFILLRMLVSSKRIYYCIYQLKA